MAARKRLFIHAQSGPTLYQFHKFLLYLDFLPGVAAHFLSPDAQPFGSLQKGLAILFRKR
ncbi:hypothetical protein [Acidithiobacillus ferrivorans]|uniref:hypothetical protein n=1 Tax=Acidithiobacillus ferrivorans TaxID=160808 RepID=UPI0011461B0E|nr:hypothetical protein [Acidithiobacillus ferrivorans]